MSAINQIASAMGSNGDEKNIILAKKLAENSDITGVEEIVEGLLNGDKNVQSDCIKVLYELGYIKPEMIAKYHRIFASILKSKNNRLVWGGMIALMTTASIVCSELINDKTMIIEVVKKGSVITQDAGIAVIAHLVPFDNTGETVEALKEHFGECEPKQIPLRLEKMGAGLTKKLAEMLLEVLETRFGELSESQLKRTKKALWIS